MVHLPRSPPPPPTMVARRWYCCAPASDATTKTAANTVSKRYIDLAPRGDRSNWRATAGEPGGRPGTTAPEKPGDRQRIFGKLRRQFMSVPKAAEGVEHSLRGGAPGKLCRAERTGGGEPFAKFAIRDQAMHRSGDGGRVARIEFQGGAGGDAVHRLDLGAAGGHAGGERLQNRQSEALEQARVEKRRSARVEIVQLFARNPTGEIHAIRQMKAIAQGMQFRREEPVDAADHEAVLRMPFAEGGEGAQQAIQILVRVQGRDSEQERLGAAAGGQLEEVWID